MTFVRIGEAKVPGPVLTLGAINPNGLAGKGAQCRSLSHGVYAVSPISLLWETLVLPLSFDQPSRPSSFVLVLQHHQKARALCQLEAVIQVLAFFRHVLVVQFEMVGSKSSMKQADVLPLSSFTMDFGLLVESFTGMQPTVNHSRSNSRPMISLHMSLTKSAFITVPNL